MIIETRAKLISAGRRTFAAKGYAATSLEELTAEAGLTRGALYHHFDGKRGLLEAVIDQIDAEMTERLLEIFDQSESRWEGFTNELVAYVEMATEPEIQRVVLLDGPAVLGDPSHWPRQLTCLQMTMGNLQQLMEEGSIRTVNAEAMSHLISGAALLGSLWIANTSDPEQASRELVESLMVLLSSLLPLPQGSRPAQP
jgi:AcrR family transcriptional regulator